MLRRVTARTMSSRERTLPKSFAAQRTKAKRAGRETQDAAAAVENLLAAVVAEADPCRPLLHPDQFDLREGVAAWGSLTAPSAVRSGNSRTNSARSMSATVCPRWKAATLMRPRMLGGDVDRQPGRIGFPFRVARRGHVRRLHPAFGIGGTGSEVALGGSDVMGDPRDFTGKRADLARGRTIFICRSEPAGLHGFGEDDALADGGGEQRRIMIGERLRGLAGEDGARRARFRTKRAAS